MALQFPFSFENIDITGIAVGLFIFFVVFGILLKSKLLGRSKAINMIVALIMAILVVQNSTISNYILNFSSNISALLITALVFVMIMALTSASGFAIFSLFILLILFLAIINIYPFSIILDYISVYFVQILIILHIAIMVFWWLFRKEINK